MRNDAQDDEGETTAYCFGVRCSAPVDMRCPRCRAPFCYACAREHSDPLASLCSAAELDHQEAGDRVAAEHVHQDAGDLAPDSAAGRLTRGRVFVQKVQSLLREFPPTAKA